MPESITGNGTVKAYPEVNPYEVSDEDIVECFEENEEYYVQNWTSYTEYLNLIE